MIFHGFEVCCPFCRGNLVASNEEEWQCESCRRNYPVIFGIPDLRTFPDPYIDFENDRAKARHLADHFDELSFEELVRFYYLTTAVVPQHHARQYMRGILSAASRAESTLQEWERTAGLQTGPEAFLEIGCGTAPLLVAAAKRFPRWIGVDIALRWLIVAKKRLTEAGFPAPLICSCAESLPIADSQFSAAAFDSTLEVVHDQKMALQEVLRVLNPGGRLFIITPNRYSLGPDPHINLWAGGYFPERWIAAYARRQKALPPKRKLLSSRTLARLLREGGFDSISLSVPEISEGQRKGLPFFLKAPAEIYNRTRNAPLISFVFRGIGPLLQGTARKPPAS